MDRRRLWKIEDHAKSVYRYRLRSIFAQAFDKQIQPLYDRIQETSDIRDLQVPPLDNQPIQDAYQRLYLTVAVPFAKQKRRTLRRQLRKGEEEIFEDLIYEMTLGYLRSNVGDIIVATGDTTVELIRQLLTELTPEILDSGMGGGQAQTMLRDRIQSAWHEAKYYRTERIVRTEVNRAANWGSLEGTKSLGVEMNKVWMSAFVKDSRDPHKAADGQKVDLYDDFEIGGEHLQYPGDPKGSAWNTINCLCGIYQELK